MTKNGLDLVIQKLNSILQTACACSFVFLLDRKEPIYIFQNGLNVAILTH